MNDKEFTERFTNLPLEWYAEAITIGRPFAFTHWGDGELTCAMGDPGQNCDGHKYFPGLSLDLRTALMAEVPDHRSPSYFYGIYDLVGSRDGKVGLGFGNERGFCGRVLRWFERANISRDFVDGQIFHDSNSHGRFGPIFRSLRNKRIMIVGPAHLRKLNEAIIPYISFVEVPSPNCYLQKKRLLEEIKATIADSSPDIVSFSASMLANVLIHELVMDDEFPGTTMIDFGSIWDPYVGVNSRYVYGTSQFQENMKENLKEK
jgi:hypothetical protein